MRIGFGAPVAGAWATPGYLTAFAGRAENAGYASLWSFQRLLVPEGSGMEPVYRSVLDPMVALGYAAAVTERIRLGVAVLNMPYQSPALVAKAAASVGPASRSRPYRYSTWLESTGNRAQLARSLACRVDQGARTISSRRGLMELR